MRRVAAKASRKVPRKRSVSLCTLHSAPLCAARRWRLLRRRQRHRRQEPPGVLRPWASELLHLALAVVRPHFFRWDQLPLVCVFLFFPGSIAKGSSSKSGCQLHLPTSHANLSRVTSPANFSCQLVESYFTCQLLMPTCRELLHLPTSHVNFLRVTSPANFSCQLFGCYLILLKAQANLSGVTSLS